MKSFILFICCFISFFVSAAEEEVKIRPVYEDGSLIAKLTYLDGKLIKRCFYNYNAQGICDKITIDDGSSEDIRSWQDVTEQVVLTFSMTEDQQIEMKQFKLDPHLGLEQFVQEVRIFKRPGTNYVEQYVVDGKGNKIEAVYDAEGRELSILEAPAEGLAILTTFLYNEKGLSSILQEDERGHVIREKNDTEEDSQNSNTVSPFYDYLVNSKGESPFLDDLKSNFETAAEFLLGEHLFKISGYHTHAMRSGVHGKGEINDKIRITLINGILNFPPTQKKHLEMFSQCHGGVNIHYIFRQCGGWTQDMFRCMASKMGIISGESLLLAEKWRELIAEMGGVGKGGTIIHYAHSIGGTDTDNARSLMTPEELKMIRVYTLASATMIQPEGFQKALNFASRRDGVCYLDPLDYFPNLFTEDHNIVYVGTFYGIPLIDHTITSESYKAVVHQLGEEFVGHYGRIPE